MAADLDEVQAIVVKLKEATKDIDTAVSKYTTLVGELKKASRKSQQALLFGTYANECMRMSGGLSNQLRKTSQLDRILDRIRANQREEERQAALREEAKRRREERAQRLGNRAWLPPSDTSFDELYSDVVEES